MEENTEQITEETTEAVEEKEYIIEQLPWNKHEAYEPTEFQRISWRESWKKCHCGRQTWINDNYCPGCGQKLGMPKAYYD